MVRTYLTEETAKIDTFCSYREKKIRLGNSESPGATSLEGESPRSRKGFLYVMIQCMLNKNDPMYVK